MIRLVPVLVLLRKGLLTKQWHSRNPNVQVSPSSDASMNPKSDPMHKR